MQFFCTLFALRGKSSPLRGKSSALQWKSSPPSVEKVQPSVEKVQRNFAVLIARNIAARNECGQNCFNPFLITLSGL